MARCGRGRGSAPPASGSFCSPQVKLTVPGYRHVQFDERRLETEPRCELRHRHRHRRKLPGTVKPRKPAATAPVADSTAKPLLMPTVQSQTLEGTVNLVDPEALAPGDRGE